MWYLVYSNKRRPEEEGLSEIEVGEEKNTNANESAGRENR